MNDEHQPLLPCPFCGGEAVVERDGNRRQSCIVACTECGGRAEGPDRDTWNRRTSRRRIQLIQWIREFNNRTEGGTHVLYYTAGDIEALADFILSRLEV